MDPKGKKGAIFQIIDSIFYICSYQMWLQASHPFQMNVPTTNHWYFYLTNEIIKA